MSTLTDNQRKALKDRAADLIEKHNRLRTHGDRVEMMEVEDELRAISRKLLGAPEPWSEPATPPRPPPLIKSALVKPPAPASRKSRDPRPPRQKATPPVTDLAPAAPASPPPPQALEAQAAAEPQRAVVSGDRIKWVGIGGSSERARVYIVAQCPECSLSMTRVGDRISCTNKHCAIYGQEFEAPTVSLKRVG